jgi:hypothetical protein
MFSGLKMKSDFNFDKHIINSGSVSTIIRAKSARVPERLWRVDEKGEAALNTPTYYAPRA